jgi:hypothetical protein
VEKGEIWVWVIASRADCSKQRVVTLQQWRREEDAVLGQRTGPSEIEHREQHANLVGARSASASIHDEAG